jgi:hypothetical protein
MPPLTNTSQQPLSLEELATTKSKRRTVNPRAQMSARTPTGDQKTSVQVKNPYLSNAQQSLTKEQGGASTVDPAAAAQLPKKLVEDVEQPIHNEQVEKKKKQQQQNQPEPPIARYTNNNQQVGERARALNNLAGEESRQLTIKQRRQKLKRQISAVQKVFREHKIDISDSEAKGLIKKGFISNFPAGLFTIALIKDLVIDPAVATFSLGSFGLGLASSATVVGAAPGVGFMGVGLGMGFFSFLFSLLVGGIRRWMSRLYFTSIFGRSKVVQKILRKQMVGDLASSIGDSIPLINVLPLPLINLWRKIALVSKITRKCKAAVDAIK